MLMYKIDNIRCFVIYFAGEYGYTITPPCYSPRTEEEKMGLQNNEGAFDDYCWTFLGTS